MEENVALETSKQKKFVKSLKGIKKLIKKTAGDHESVGPKLKSAKKSNRKRPERGLVYLSHIPHGFYEHEMTQYFKQFGAVSNARVIRSKRTGNSKGCAFVEFKQPAVAEIVAETMNNYLMGKRLIKAAYVPPEKQKLRAMRKHWSRLNNPGRTERLKQKKAFNTDKDEKAELVKARKTFSNFNKNMKKLSELGINYDFFTPVDMPEGLTDTASQIKDNSSQMKDSKDSKQKKDKEIKEVTKKAVKEVKESKESKKEKNKPEPVVNKKDQLKKQQKLKDSGVKLPESFIKINEEDSDDSDDADFDSDDYNKMLESESDAESGEESDEEDEVSEESGPGEEDEFEITGSDDDESDGEEESDEEILPPPKNGPRGKGHVIPQPAQIKKENKKQGKKKEGKPLELKGPVAQKGTKGQVQQNGSKGPVQQKGPKGLVSQKGVKGPVQQNGPKGPVQQQGPKGPVKQNGPKGPVQQKGPKGPVQQKGPKEPVQQKGPIVPEQNKRKAPQKNAVSPKKPKFEKQTQLTMKKQFKKKK